MSGESRSDPEKEAAALLDKVMRGEVQLLFPPGTLAASAFVPCFAIGAGALTISLALAISVNALALYLSGAFAIALTAVAGTGHFLVVRGRTGPRNWIRIYVRVLMGCTIVTVLAAVLSGRAVPWVLMVVALVAFLLSGLILGSKPYLAFASFFALKRRYRQNQEAAQERVLGPRPRGSSATGDDSS